jgi:hypothetical protein
MAVVVFPTPPFWFAMATIIEGCTDCNTLSRHRTRGTLHLVFAEVVRIDTLEPLVQPIGVGLFR